MSVDVVIDSCIQIETTTRCTLKCPACSRTQFAERFNKPVPRRDIDPDVLWNFFNCDSGKKVTQFLLCGDWGDSIYYPRLFDLIDKFRSLKKFHLVTNGSYRNADWWHNLLSRLGPEDTIEFSIDGLEDTNHLYRRNSDWKSTMAALEIAAASPVQLIWATNVFNFNHQQLPEIKALAQSFGATWKCKLTSRFGDPSLRPPEHLVDRDAEFYHGLVEKSLTIDPKCKTTSQNSISSYHIFVPCGWFCHPFVFYNGPIWKNRDNWSIENTNMDDLVANVLKPWVESILDNPDQAPSLCKMRCKPNQPLTIFYE